LKRLEEIVHVRFSARRLRWPDGRASLGIVLRDVFAQGAIDACLGTLAIRRTFSEPGDQIGIEAQR
jgi:hypothetical protein